MTSVLKLLNILSICVSDGRGEMTSVSLKRVPKRDSFLFPASDDDICIRHLI